MSEAHKDKVLEPPGAREPTVDPMRRIVDAHHHLWPRFRVFGYLPEEYRQDASTHSVAATIFAECNAHYDREGPEHLRCVGETRYIVRACPPIAADASEPFIGAGIVSRVDLTLPPRDVREALETHVDAGAGRFKGIRYSTIAWSDPDALPGNRRNPPGIMRSDGLKASFAELAAMDLTFDAWLSYLQLPELAELADKFPDTAIVLNHFGGPLNPTREDFAGGGGFDTWRRGIREIALRPNVHIKLGGVGMTVFGRGYEDLEASPSSDRIVADWAPFLDVCVDSFGPSRCMFESNFSADKVSMTFHNQWNAFKKMTAAYSEEEKEQLFSGTAEAVYTLMANA